MSVTQWTTGIQHIGIPTSDIETTIRFYEGLGFQTTAQIFRLLMHGSVSRDIKCCRMELKNFHFGKRVWLSLLSKDRIKNGSSSVNGNSNGTLPL